MQELQTQIIKTKTITHQRTIPTSNREIVETEPKSIPLNTHIHKR